MDYLFINTCELSALMGLPHIQQLAYLLGIRPYMDRKTMTVGIKRRISYQSLTEALYVEPHQGIEFSGSPSRQQLRRVIQGLERAGLIKVQSVGKQLILKCLLANADNSVQNKPDTNPTQQPNTKPNTKNIIISMNYEKNSQKPDIAKTAKPDTPHNSENSYIYLREKFQKFWSLYPHKSGKQKAWTAFQNLKPDDLLFERLIHSLTQQIAAIDAQIAHGIWVPHWKYPANWLEQRSWEDEINLEKIMERTHAKHEANPAKNAPYDLFWESCKGGADFDFDDNATHSNATNVYSFRKS